MELAAAPPPGDPVKQRPQLQAYPRPPELAGAAAAAAVVVVQASRRGRGRRIALLWNWPGPGPPSKELAARTTTGRPGDPVKQRPNFRLTRAPKSPRIESGAG